MIYFGELKSTSKFFHFGTFSENFSFYFVWQETMPGCSQIIADNEYKDFVYLKFRSLD